MNISIIVGLKKDTNECPSQSYETPAEDIVVMKGIKN